MILEVWLTMLTVAALLCGVVLAFYIVFALGTIEVEIDNVRELG